jgi:hypothetical protein
MAVMAAMVAEAVIGAVAAAGATEAAAVAAGVVVAAVVAGDGGGGDTNLARRTAPFCVTGVAPPTLIVATSVQLLAREGD